MKWITREHPKIDRLACPWLIRRFIDPQAEIIYVPFDEVLSKAEQLNAILFDIPGVEYTHYGNECTFDYLIKKHNIKDDVLRKFIKQKEGKNMPAWAQELKDLIQDHIDTNITLKELSKDLDINPSYLSREFSKHFDNLSYGDYIRKLRIEKAIELMNNSSYSLTDISYFFTGVIANNNRFCLK